MGFRIAGASQRDGAFMSMQPALNGVSWAGERRHRGKTVLQVE
ncbi:MAG: hypothetical protein VCD66_06140 [Alphaproteobacteria bacterium]